MLNKNMLSNKQLVILMLLFIINDLFFVALGYFACTMLCDLGKF